MRIGEKPVKLSVVVGTYNRLDLIRLCLESIAAETRTDYRIYVTDAGSTDGTVEYLRSIVSERVVPIFVGERLGQARAYNQVFDMVTSPFVCWLSDDNVVVNHSLDIAISILESDSNIGLVGLKTRDLRGPFSHLSYIGGISSVGIINVNQGMLPTAVLKELKGFSESFSNYGIDPDLTARVLYSGRDVVHTREIALHHYRNWSTDPSSPEFLEMERRQAAYLELYERKYGATRRYAWGWFLRRLVWAVPREIARMRIFEHAFLWLTRHAPQVIARRPWMRRFAPGWHPLSPARGVPPTTPAKQYFGLQLRDWHNLLTARYTNPIEALVGRARPYHLRQRCPRLLRPSKERLASLEGG